MTSHSRARLALAVATVALAASVAAGADADDTQTQQPAPPTPAAAVAANGPTVALLVDASGSMTDAMEGLRPCLKAAVRRLRPDCRFYLGLFAQGDPRALADGELIEATDANKEAACRLIDGLKPVGQTMPERAFRKVFALKPDALYLITDGEMDTTALRLITRLNRSHTTAVHLRLVVSPTDPTVLSKTARDNGGTCAWIDRRAPVSHAEVLRPEHSDDGVEVFGVVDRAERVALVCDVSTADAGIAVPVKLALTKAVRRLSSRQRFYLAWSAVSTPYQMPGKTMLVADERAKRDAKQFLDMLIPLGTISPDRALERAFEEKPDVLFFISSSSIDRVLAAHVARLNADRKVKVHTIGLCKPLGESTLREIAKAHGGTYTRVSEDGLMDLVQP